MAAPTMLSLDTFGDRSYKDQRTHGDMLKSSFLPDVTTKVKVETVEFDVAEIRKLRDKLTEDEKVQFKCDYGRLLTLIDVKVDWGCIRAALKFWDPYYRCFSFSEGIDLTPTLEEYATLLCFIPPVTSVYQNVRLESTDVKLRLDKLLGITTRQRDGKYIWCWSDVVDQFHLAQGEKRLRILAFAMVGLFLFPNMKNCIDFEAANIFYEMEVNGVNPTTAILAETFRSLDLCRRTRRGKFACCTQLLTVWLISHFKQRPDQSLFVPSYIGMNPLVKVISGMGQEISVDKWKLEEKEVWVDRFLNLSEEDIDRHAKWLRIVNPIVSCGYLRWIPLIGARGCVPYCPALVLSQFSIIQIVPATFGMPSSSLPHSEDTETFRQYANEWRAPFCLEGHIIPTQPTREYLEWRRNRINGSVLPQPENQKRTEEKGEYNVEEGVSYVAYALLMEQLRVEKEERDRVMKEKDDALTEKMDLELKMRKMERHHKEKVRAHLMNQRILEEDLNRRLNVEISKREASSALLRERDEENQALRVRIAILEAEVKKQKKKIALIEQMGENSASSRVSK